MKYLLRWLLVCFYQVEVVGLDNFNRAGNRTLIIANHTSFLDAVLLAVFLPGRLTFAINTHIARKLWVRPFLGLTRVFAMDPANPLSAKALIRFLKEGNRAVIFPEGRITVTGTLMKIYDGPGMIAEKSGATLLPVRIEGAQYTPFSRMRGRVRLRWFPKIRLTVLEPFTMRPGDDGQRRKTVSGKRLSRVMTEMMFATSQYRQTLFEALLDARRIHGGDHLIMEDIERHPYSYNRLIRGAFMLGRKLARKTSPDEHVGVLMPGVCSTLLTLFGLQIHRRVPTMLDYTLGVRGLKSACETAGVNTVVTSRAFIERSQRYRSVNELAEQVQLIYLEDIAARISLLDRFRGRLSSLFSGLVYKRLCLSSQPDDAAVVVFTAGTGNRPKGVVLSHANLLANRAQLSVCIDLNARDVVLNALPLFHAFGLSSGALLPLLSGVKVFFYPNPEHYRVVPEMAYAINATILFGMDRFLERYVRCAHAYDFYSVRYVVAGAEKLRDCTRRLWAEKCGVRIFESYGCTETCAVLSTNSPIYNLPGSAGQVLPGIQYRIVAEQSIPGVGRLHVKGPSIMLGYLLHSRPGRLVKAMSSQGEGWYDTGDLVSRDEQGFLFVHGRAEDFVELQGRTVSLGEIEAVVARLWPDNLHAVVSLPESGAHRLVLVTDRAEAHGCDLQQCLLSQGINDAVIPHCVVHVDTLPLLGSGKTNYKAIRAIARSAA
jgi:acyl-[acyl-carrier-protein]-phospholipid O-acyltransferase/long-chain-fatty-acid--[acyl-carrier-protein] ligase